MEFNACAKNAGTTNFNNAKKKFEASGYKLPEVVFRNVSSRNRQQPVTKNEQGVMNFCWAIYFIVQTKMLDLYLLVPKITIYERASETFSVVSLTFILSVTELMLSEQKCQESNL